MSMLQVCEKIHVFDHENGTPNMSRPQALVYVSSESKNQRLFLKAMIA